MRSASPNTNQRQRRMNIVWRCVLALFVLRALLPVGFMPDFSAGSHHGMTLVFCTMGGGKPHLMDMSGTAGKADSGKATHHMGEGECAFAVAAAPALPTVLSLELPVFEHLADAVSEEQRFIRPGSTRGPPLGARAPPDSLS